MLGLEFLAPPTKVCSSECAEGMFCELLGMYLVLRRSAVIQNKDVGTDPSRIRPFLRLTLRCVFLSAFGYIALLGKEYS